MDRVCTHAGDADHTGQGAQLFDHAGQVHTVVHAGQQGDEAALVFQLNPQLDVEFAGDILGPRELDAFFRVVADFGDVAAVVQVHHHAFAGGQVADNRVTRDRCAALGVAEHQALGAANCQRAFRA